MNASFIKEYQLEDPSICDAFLELFEKAKELGLAGQGVVGADTKYRPNVKDSLDFWLGDANPIGKPSEFKWPEYHTELSGFIDNYCEEYKLYEYAGKFEMRQPPQIQFYQPGRGYFAWHIDGAHELCDRALTFITYLDDAPDGGTEFMYQDVVVEAVKGKTIIFPCSLTHIHRGQISPTHHKHILVGWVWWDNQP
jgi:hypothetical protein